MAIRIDGEVLSGTRSMTVDVDVVDQGVLDITSSPTTIPSNSIVFIRNAGSMVLIVNGNTDHMFDLEPGEFVLLRSPDDLILICESETLAEVVNITIPFIPELAQLGNESDTLITDENLNIFQIQ